MHFETKAGCPRTWFGPIKRESYGEDGQGGVVDATRAWRREREATPGSAGQGKGDRAEGGYVVQYMALQGGWKKKKLSGNDKLSGLGDTRVNNCTVLIFNYLILFS